MLKLIRIILALVGLVVIVFLSIDNRQIVDFGLWPLPYAYQVPLYWIILGSLAVGVILGGLTSWLSHVSARGQTRELRRKVGTIEKQEEAQREARERAAVEEARRKTQALTISPPSPQRASEPALIGPGR